VGATEVALIAVDEATAADETAEEAAPAATAATFTEADPEPEKASTAMTW